MGIRLFVLLPTTLPTRWSGARNSGSHLPSLDALTTYHVIRFGGKTPATHKKLSSSLSTDQKIYRSLKKTLDRPKTFRWVKNSRPVKKFSTGKIILDLQKNFSTVEKILDRPKTSRPTRRNLARSI